MIISNSAISVIVRRNYKALLKGKWVIIILGINHNKFYKLVRISAKECNLIE